MTNTHATNRQILDARTLLLITACVLLALIAVIAYPQKSRAQNTTIVSSQMGLGSRGSQVAALQKFLATDPKVYPEGLVTGYFGPLTESAVMNFQIGYGLPPAGRVGPMTLQTINSLMKSGTAIDVSAPTIIQPTVSVNGKTATVNWQTNEPASGKVFYSTAEFNGIDATTAKTEPTFENATVTADSSFSAAKSIELQNLIAGTTYYYVIESIDQSGNVSVTNETAFKT